MAFQDQETNLLITTVLSITDPTGMVHEYNNGYQSMRQARERVFAIYVHKSESPRLPSKCPKGTGFTASIYLLCNNGRRMPLIEGGRTVNKYLGPNSKREIHFPNFTVEFLDCRPVQVIFFSESVMEAMRKSFMDLYEAIESVQHLRNTKRYNESNLEESIPKRRRLLEEEEKSCKTWLATFDATEATLLNKLDSLLV